MRDFRNFWFFETFLKFNKTQKIVYAKKNKSPDQKSVDQNEDTSTNDFTLLTNQELITDASGKLKKLGARAAGIYVDYLGDWSRADNYRHKHDKMQTVLMQYLKKELSVRDFDAINRQYPLKYTRRKIALDWIFRFDEAFLKSFYYHYYSESTKR